MTFQLPNHLQCPSCGAVAYPTDQAIRASQSNASWSSVPFKCSAPTCRRVLAYSPHTGRLVG